jgi:D-arabinose 1-dehydrogenase-like Zn-dependent alcohol dehydrogenase
MPSAGPWSWNLCENAGFTGYTINGGYAEHTVADERFCFPIPDGYSDAHAAPLLCAGLNGLPLPDEGGRRAAAGHLRLRRGRAHRLPDRASSGPQVGDKTHDRNYPLAEANQALTNLRTGKPRCRSFDS